MTKIVIREHNFMNKFVKFLIIAILFVFIFALSGCANRSMEDAVKTESIVIADQFGLAYAPLEIMKEKHFLEEALEAAGLSDVSVSWQKFGNTTAIREAMLSGDLDIGFVGIPPFLLGLDNGMDWKIFSGLSESKVALVSKDLGVQNLKDLTKSHKVILPQPGSIQHILLQMASKEQLGDAGAFDDQLIALAHPDGVTAFTAGDEAQLHFTTPPYLQEDLKVQGATEILDGISSFGGEFTFIVGICQGGFYENQEQYQALQLAIQRSVTFMEENPDESLAILSAVYEYPTDVLKSLISDEQMSFTTEVKGLEKFVDFMVETGALKKDYNSDELSWNKVN